MKICKNIYIKTESLLYWKANKYNLSQDELAIISCPVGRGGAESR